MHARAVDEACSRLRELRRELREDLGLAGVTLVLAVGATQLHPALAVPLFVGALAVGVLGVRALWRHWNLLESLAGEPDAYVVPEVLARASRDATMERRRALAMLIRSRLRHPGLACAERVEAAREELEALATDLEDGALLLDPACAVACARLLTDLDESSLLDPARARDELGWRVRRIRSGFSSSSLAA